MNGWDRENRFWLESLSKFYSEKKSRFCISLISNLPFHSMHVKKTIWGWSVGNTVYTITVYTALACQTIPPMGCNFSAVKPLDIRVVAVDIFVFVYFVATGEWMRGTQQWRVWVNLNSGTRKLYSCSLCAYKTQFRDECSSVGVSKIQLKNECSSVGEWNSIHGLVGVRENQFRDGCSPIVLSKTQSRVERSSVRGSQAQYQRWI